MYKYPHLATFLVLLFSLSANAQCLQVPVALNQKIDNSSLIVEAEVIESKSVWSDASKTAILTIHELKPFTSYKGFSNQEIFVKTLGGQIGDKKMVVHPEVHLEPGSVGVFFLKPTSDGLFEVYGVEQGFYKYDAIDKSASTGFDEFSLETNELGALISARTSVQPQTVNEFDVETWGNFGYSTASVSALSPQNVRAGMGDVLTINGSNFGATQGSSAVFFSNADSGGANYISAPAYSILSWSDTQIQVEVPSGAGTGRVIVQANGANQFSPADLTVNFHATNLVHSNQPYRGKHASENTLGGYSFRLSTNFETNEDAVARTREVLAQWTGYTGINWDISSQNSSVTTAAQDDVNIISFDTPDNQLPDGVLGRASSWYSGCSTGNGVWNWHISELDIVFDAETTWNFSASDPTSGKVDFYSVSLHEFGHAHQLGHLIDETSVMHYSIAPGQSKREINANELSGASILINESSSATPSCGPDAHIKIMPTPIMAPVEQCTTILVEDIEQYQWSTAKQGEHIVAQFNPQGNTNIAYVNVGIYLDSEDVSSNSDSNSAKRRFEFKAYDSSDNIVTFTEPVSVRMLYDSQEIDDLLAIKGLTSIEETVMIKNDSACGSEFSKSNPTNTQMTCARHPLGQEDYMLEVSGINEFSSFFLLDDVNILPIKLSYFEGAAVQGKVELAWESLSEVNSKHFEVERLHPQTGIWETVATVEAAGNSSQAIQYSAVDQFPHAGENQYRLKQVDADESFEYSNIVQVEIDEVEEKMLIYQNQVLIRTQNAETLRVFNFNGQLVKELDVNGSSTAEINGLSDGLYFIQLVGNNGILESKKAFLR